MSSAKRVYIGDGVYAWTDGWGWWIETERIEGTARVYLEPEVFAKLRELFEKN
tara:strand:+ start:4145 stop:4303 length:159 start_codon:yes stop_codon:yes gene_type:complete